MLEVSATEFTEISECELIIGGQVKELTPDYSLRFCITLERVFPIPVLYFRGSRVTQEWSLSMHSKHKEQELSLSHEEAEDIKGKSSNIT